MSAYQAALPLEEFLDHAPVQKFSAQARAIPDHTVWRAIELIDRSGLVEAVEG